MTALEVCEKYKVSESTLKSAFARTQASILKKHGIKIIKEGRGDKAVYREVIESDGRAETMFKETESLRNTGLIKTDLSIPNFTFTVFLGLITTPMMVFRGNERDFLKYIEVDVNEKNLQLLNEAFEDLQDNDIITKVDDKSTDEGYFTIILKRKAEVEMKIGISMIRDCKILAEKYHKQDWIPLLKVWVGTELLSKNDTYTRQELMDLTGLTMYQLKTCSSILVNHGVYKTSRAYQGMMNCIGMRADMNIEELYTI